MGRASRLAGFSTSIVGNAPNNLVVGVITATSFVGDGSGLTNAGSTLAAGSGSQRVVLTSLTSGTMTSAATNANLLFNSTTGVLTATTFSGNITGTAATFTGNVSIAGTLTYEDVTNVDSIGVITARSGIVVSAGGINATGVVTATSFSGSGANLTGLPASGVQIRSAGTTVGSAITSINFQSGATVTASGAGSTITISAGIQTAAYTPSGITTTLLLSSAQDHKVTASGITTITVSGGTEGDSHTVRIVNSGIATVGFSTYFLFPSGSPPVLPTTSGAISLLSFTVHRVGTAGTQLLAGASLNFS